VLEFYNDVYDKAGYARLSGPHGFLPGRHAHEPRLRAAYLPGLDQPFPTSPPTDVHRHDKRQHSALSELG
jgi:hypothetical protein